MVLESLLNPLKAEKKPWEMFFLGLLYNSIAIFLSLWIFKRQSSFAMVFFTVMASIPIVYNTLKYEESKDMKISDERKLMHEHNRAIKVMAFLFLGVVVSCVFWYSVLPTTSTNSVFSEQIKTISEINNRVSSQVTGFATSTDILFKIFFNNLKVLIFCILFAFLYGAGAVFILTWNATVIAAAVGNTIRNKLAGAAAYVGLERVAHYFGAVSYGFLKYTIHGIPEILSYFYGGVAGGIISVAIIRNHFATDKASAILLDVGELVLIALGFLLVGAVFEVFLTPVLF